jgi:hypothetical protein
LHANVGWVSVGVDHDTLAFAVATIRTWWLQMGLTMYPQAKELLITADSGGSNSARARLWKRELQRFADESGLRIRVSHLPPGTSKWNKIEHRMFCHITANWRGKPLESREWWSVSWARPPRRRACESRRLWTLANIPRVSTSVMPR